MTPKEHTRNAQILGTLLAWEDVTGWRKRTWQTLTDIGTTLTKEEALQALRLMFIKRDPTKTETLYLHLIREHPELALEALDLHCEHKHHRPKPLLQCLRKLLKANRHLVRRRLLLLQ